MKVTTSRHLAPPFTPGSLVIGNTPHSRGQIVLVNGGRKAFSDEHFSGSIIDSPQCPAVTGNSSDSFVKSDYEPFSGLVTLEQ